MRERLVAQSGLHSALYTFSVAGDETTTLQTTLKGTKATCEAKIQELEDAKVKHANLVWF